MALNDLKALRPDGYRWWNKRNKPLAGLCVHYAGAYDSALSVVKDNIKDEAWVRAHPDASKAQAEAAGVRLTPRSFHISNGQGDDEPLVCLIPPADVAWHAPGLNVDFLGVENVAPKGAQFTPAQERRLITIGETLIREHNIKYITAHRFGTKDGEGSTDCPGWLFGPGGPPNPKAQSKAVRTFGPPSTREQFEAWVSKHFGSSYIVR